jgi:predicted metal-dependent HD superfamily phosphohydrolase
MPTLSRWRAAWRALGVEAPDDALFRQVMDRHAEVHRAYHTAEHLDDCLARLDLLRGEAEHPAEVELAIWFHDAIYDPGSPDNERRSAEWAREACLGAGVPRAVTARIESLVLATRHDAPPTTTDGRVIADADLGILGAAPDRFDRYEQQVRQEYARVPAPRFRRERRRILEGFLARPRIYLTEAGLRQLEAPARENLRRAIRRLGG